MNRNSHKSVVINQLSAGYQVEGAYLPVLKGISSEVDSGSLVCLMGPNGAGKSTLLRCICGLQQYEGGNIIIENEKADDLSPHVLAKKLAVVLTDPISAPHMTVKELLAMGRYPYLGWMLKFSDADRKIINNTARQCGIDHLLNKPVQSLSDGQRQKVLIARALIQESSILILDEPTSHLDLNNRVEIINLLKQISRTENKTVIMATHELDLALQMADRLLLLDNAGRLYQGIPEDLVLNGILDKVFSFKGYDLKTGRVQHQRTERQISLLGNGHVYLWTKNALEREGFEIMDASTEIISIVIDDNGASWHYEEKAHSSIEDLLSNIKKGH